MSRRRLDITVSVEEMKHMFDNGMSKEEIADSLGISRSTIYRWLKGYTRNGGGKVSRSIPLHYIHRVKNEDRNCINKIAANNATNARLVVQEKTITLKGTIGEYLVEPAKKIVTANIGGNLIDLDFDIIVGFIEELKAIGRNIEYVAVGNEMW